MAYSEQITTTVMDIPALIATFAASLGWTVDGLTITRPGGGRSFTLSASIGGTNNRDHFVFVRDTLLPTKRYVYTAMPWINGVFAAPEVQEPTKVHLLGNAAPYDPEPWIACVIECGYNLYRHIYIGNVAKVGGYTGGELISANMYCRSVGYSGAGGTVSYGYSNLGSPPAHRYLFSARWEAEDMPHGVSVGGVNVVHANNAKPYRYFDGPTGTTPQVDFTGVEVFGGASDGVSAGLVSTGLSNYAGSNILVPVNLFIPESTLVGPDVKMRPIGYAAGVRMVNTKGINPGDAIIVGSKTWRVFPEFSRQTETTTPYGYENPDGFYFPYETSGNLGLAYEEV